LNKKSLGSKIVSIIKDGRYDDYANFGFAALFLSGFKKILKQPPTIIERVTAISCLQQLSPLADTKTSF
jgi:hypothetical protein